RVHLCTYCMEEGGVRYHLVNPGHSLSRAILERGIPGGIRFSVEEERYDAIRDSLGSLLELFADALTHPMMPHADDDRLVMIYYNTPPRHDKDHQIIVIDIDENIADYCPENINISITDMLSIQPLDGTNACMNTWFERARSGDESPSAQSGHYWCSAQDVAEALLRAFPFMTPGLEPYTVSGRRYWPSKDTWTEIKLLADRTLAGQSGQFELKHLLDDGGPAVEVEVLDGRETRRQRPNISRFHELLEENTGEGWNPRTPLRQSLMLLLAEWVAEQS
ncbi:MAG: hypothetical protein ACPHZ6_02965, partial [Poseidonia sp.]